MVEPYSVIKFREAVRDVHYLGARLGKMRGSIVFLEFSFGSTRDVTLILIVDGLFGKKPRKVDSDLDQFEESIKSIVSERLGGTKHQKIQTRAG